MTLYKVDGTYGESGSRAPLWVERGDSGGVPGRNVWRVAAGNLAPLQVRAVDVDRIAGLANGGDCSRDQEVVGRVSEDQVLAVDWTR